MAVPARIYDALELLNLCRHKFEGIFDMHGVRTGSPEDVPEFLKKLHDDRYFAMDFWGLVGSLEGIGDRISERQIRRSVMDCVCGEWLPSDDLENWLRSINCSMSAFGREWRVCR